MGKLIGIAVFVGLVMLAILGIILIVALVLAWPFMWLWNYAVVFAFPGVAVLDYWHAYWLFVFITVFLSGLRGSSSSSS